MAEKTGSSSAVARARARLKKIQSKKGGGGDFPFKFLNLEDGVNVVRVFKSWCYDTDQEADFAKEVPYHRSVGPEGKQVKCRGKIGKACPICEEAEKWMAKAKASKKTGDKAQVDKLFKRAGSLKARPKFFMNAITLTTDGAKDGDGADAVKPEVLSCGPQVMEGILQQFVDEEADVGGKFWEDDSRYDFRIIKSGKDLGTKYEVKTTTKYVDVDTAEMEKELHDLDELFAEFPSYKEAQAILQGVEYDPDEDDEDEEPAAKKSTDDEEDDDEEDVDVDEAPKAKKKVKKDEDEEEPEEEEEEAEEDEEPAPKKKAKKVEEEDEEEPEEEDEEEEAPKKKAKKPAADEEDEDEEEEPEEDEEEAPKAKKAKKVEEEDEEEEESEEADEEDETPKKKGKKPVCFGDADDFNPKDAMCKVCPWQGDCKKAIDGEGGGDEDEDEVEEEPEEKPNKKLSKIEEKLKKKAKK